eukprot:IDg6734t1
MYTSNTPTDYEPPLFRRAREEEISWFSEKPTRVSTGSVTTPYHHISMSIRSSQGRANEDEKSKITKKGHSKIEIGKGCNLKAQGSGIKIATNLTERDGRSHIAKHLKKKTSSRMATKNASASKSTTKAASKIAKSTRSQRTKKMQRCLRRRNLTAFHLSLHHLIPFSCNRIKLGAN